MSPVRPVIVLQHVAREGPGTLGTALRAAGLPVRIVKLFRGAPVLPPPRAIAGLVLMGGPMAVYDKNRSPFLRREIAYVRRVLATDTPVLGVCLGAQIVAHALGARVYPNAQKEIGWFRVQLTDAAARDPLFRKAARSPWVFQWHGDTFALPKRSTLLATSPLCRHQAFRHGRRVYGLQYHWEVDGDMVRRWVAHPAGRRELAALAPGIGDRIHRETPARLPDLAPQAARVFSAFAALCRSVSRSV